MIDTMERMKRIHVRKAMTDEEFFVWLTSEDGGSCVEVKDLGDGIYAAIRRLMYHWTMIVGMVGDINGYEDRWCYATRELAEKGIREWDGNGEPSGWHRNPRTGRRRTNGDPKTEYVDW